jgi:hypothetical protein
MPALLSSEESSTRVPVRAVVPKPISGTHPLTVYRCSTTSRSSLASGVLESNSLIPMIHATVAQLRRSFNRLRTEAQRDNRPHSCLLLFYAAECGLKCALLRGKRLRSTVMIEPTHDFSLLLKNLKIPRAQVSAPPNFRLRNDTSGHFDSSYAHQAWRYGVDMESQDEIELVEWMRNLCAYLEPIL